MVEEVLDGSSGPDLSEPAKLVRREACQRTKPPAKSPSRIRDSRGTPPARGVFFHGESAAESAGSLRDTMDTTSNLPAHRLRVLIAEDDDDLRALLAQTLEQEGHDVVELEDGFELGGYVEVSHRSVTGRIRPDVIITDVRMPGRDGLEVARQAREAGLTCPIIVVSAFANPAIRQASAELGDATFLAKPLDVEAVAASISSVARRANSPAL